MNIKEKIKKFAEVLINRVEEKDVKFPLGAYISDRFIQRDLQKRGSITKKEDIIDNDSDKKEEIQDTLSLGETPDKVTENEHEDVKTDEPDIVVEEKMSTKKISQDEDPAFEYLLQQIKETGNIDDAINVTKEVFNNENENTNEMVSSKKYVILPNKKKGYVIGSTKEYVKVRTSNGKIGLFRKEEIIGA